LVLVQVVKIMVMMVMMWSLVVIKCSSCRSLVMVERILTVQRDWVV
jgi:hypothetical protein